MSVLDKVIAGSNEPVPVRGILDKVLDNTGPVRQEDTSFHRAYQGFKGDSQYDDYLTIGSNQNKLRAQNQPFLDEVGNSLVKTVPGIALGIAENAGYLAELLSNDQDYTNTLTELAKAGRAKLEEELPTYQEDPNKVWNLGDTAWWVNHGQGLVESVGEFLVTGAGVGKALGTGAKLLTKALPLRGAELGSKVLQGAAQLGTASGLAYTEGAMSGAEVYKRVLAETGNKELAAKSAAETVRLNTIINTGLNITALSPLFRSAKKLEDGVLSGLSRNAKESLGTYIKRLTLLESQGIPQASMMKKLALEAGQESTEEVVNLFAERQGEITGGIRKSKGDYLDNFLDAAMSEEGALSATLGAIGGVAQTAGMEYAPLKTTKNADGTTSRISARNLEAKDKLDYQKVTISNLKKDIETIQTSQKKLNDAVATGDKIAIEEARQELFNVGVFKSLRNETSDQLSKEIAGIATVDNVNIGEDGQTDAMRQRLADNIDDNQYKEKALRKASEIKLLNKEYRDLIAYTEDPFTASEIFRNRLNMNMYESIITDLDKDINKTSADITKFSTDPDLLDGVKLEAEVRAYEIAEKELRQRGLTQQADGIATESVIVRSLFKEYKANKPDVDKAIAKQTGLTNQFIGQMASKLILNSKLNIEKIAYQEALQNPKEVGKKLEKEVEALNKANKEKEAERIKAEEKAKRDADFQEAVLKAEQVKRRSKLSEQINNAQTEKDLDAFLEEADNNNLTSPELIDQISKKREELTKKESALTYEETVEKVENPLVGEKITVGDKEATIKEVNKNLDGSIFSIDYILDFDGDVNTTTTQEEIDSRKGTLYVKDGKLYTREQLEQEYEPVIDDEVTVEDEPVVTDESITELAAKKANIEFSRKVSLEFISEITSGEEKGKFNAPFYINSSNTRAILADTRQEVVDKLNAGYDAQLKALEKAEGRKAVNDVEEIIFSNPAFKLEGFEISGHYWNVVTSTDRAKVLVSINGVIVPFYLTTGQAGKGLIPGWYPFFGVGKDGWLNKTDKPDMETYYERYWGEEVAKIVQSIAQGLNNFYGTSPAAFSNDGDPTATSKPLATLADKVEDYINSKLSFTPAINNADARNNLRSNVEQLGKEIITSYNSQQTAEDGISDVALSQITSLTAITDLYIPLTTKGKEAQDKFINDTLTELNDKTTASNGNHNKISYKAQEQDKKGNTIDPFVINDSYKTLHDPDFGVDTELELRIATETEWYERYKDNVEKVPIGIYHKGKLIGYLPTYTNQNKSLLLARSYILANDVSMVERRKQIELNAKDPQSGRLKREFDGDVVNTRRIVDEFIKNKGQNLEAIEGWNTLRGDIQELLFEGEFDKAKAKIPQTYEERVNAKYANQKVVTVTTKVINKSPGNINKTEKGLVADNYAFTPQFVIGRNGRFESSLDVAFNKDVINTSSALTGIVYTVNTTANGKNLLLPVDINRVSAEQVDSLMKVLDLYFKGAVGNTPATHTEEDIKLIKEAQEEYGFDPSTPAGLKNYFDKFFYSTNLNSQTEEGKANIERISKDLGHTNHYVQVSSRGLKFMESGGTLQEFTKADMQDQAKLDRVIKHLQQTFSRVDLAKIASKGKFEAPIFNKDNTITKYSKPTYADHVASVTSTNIASVKIAEGKQTALVQPTIHISFDFMQKPSKENISFTTETGEKVVSLASPTPEIVSLGTMDEYGSDEFFVDPQTLTKEQLEEAIKKCKPT